MTIALVYDPRYHTFESWASLMVEAYGAQQLEIPNAQTNWQEWASGFNGIPIFAADGVAMPNPYVFSTWEEWAASTVNVVTLHREGNSSLQ